MWKNLNWWTGKSQYWEACKSIFEPFGAGWGVEEDYIVLRRHVIGQSHLRYHGFWEFAKRQRITNYGLMKYLGEYAARPQLEMLGRIGMDNIIRRLIYGGRVGRLNWRAKTPWGLLGLSKGDWKLYMTNQPLDGLPYIKRLMKEAGADWRTAEALLDGMCWREDEFCTELPALLKSTGVSAKRAAAWFEKQNRSRSYWLDYLQMARKLGYDLTRERVAFPKDLTEAHDRAVSQVKWEEDKALAAAYGPRYEKLAQVYTYEADGLAVVVPKSQNEIIAEGKILEHCVGGYARRHMEGTNTILFIRQTEQPETPFLTVQVDGEQIIQVHGYRNDRGRLPAEVEYKEFLGQWLREVHRRRAGA